MKTKVYTLDEIELVDGPKTEKKGLKDLTESDDNNVLYRTIMSNPPLRSVYERSTSLNMLKMMFDRLYIYTEAQWEYLDVLFQFDLEDQMAK